MFPVHFKQKWGSIGATTAGRLDDDGRQICRTTHLTVCCMADFTCLVWFLTAVLTI